MNRRRQVIDEFTFSIQEGTTARLYRVIVRSNNDGPPESVRLERDGDELQPLFDCNAELVSRVAQVITEGRKEVEPYSDPMVCVEHGYYKYVCKACHPPATDQPEPEIKEAPLSIVPDDDVPSF